MLAPHKSEIAALLTSKTKAELIELLTQLYAQSHGKDTWELFDELIFQSLCKGLNYAWLNEKVDEFVTASLRGDYLVDPYPKHFLEIPERTEEWINEFSCLTDLCCVLCQTGAGGKGALQKLHALLQVAFDDGSIIFAHELGEWMFTPRFRYEQYLDPQ